MSVTSAFDWPGTPSAKWTTKATRSSTTRSCTLMNAGDEAVTFRFPKFEPGLQWNRVLDTFDDAGRWSGSFAGGAKYRSRRTPWLSFWGSKGNPAA